MRRSVVIIRFVVVGNPATTRTRDRNRDAIRTIVGTLVVVVLNVKAPRYAVPLGLQIGVGTQEQLHVNTNFVEIICRKASRNYSVPLQMQIKRQICKIVKLTDSVPLQIP